MAIKQSRRRFVTNVAAAGAVVLARWALCAAVAENRLPPSRRRK